MSYANIRVLIIDDKEIVQKIIRPMLTKELGFVSENIYDTFNGRKALEILQTTHINLTLCEWDVPQISGLNLLRAIRQDKKLASLPFILVTKENDQSVIVQAAQEKVSQVIVKPFSAHDFSIKLKQVLERDRREHPRQQVPQTKKLKLTVLYEGKPVTTGTIANISKGGLLAQLPIYRGMTVNDQVLLQISQDSAEENIIHNSFQAGLIRIERDAKAADKNIAYYAFMFLNLNQNSQKILDDLIAFMG